LPWLQARQHGHLRAAFHLKDANRICLTKHLIHIRVALRHTRKIERTAIMLFDELKRTADATQHAKRQHIDLQYAERIKIILVPFDEGAIFHRRILDRHHFFKWPFRDDEAANMLREMARKSDQLARKSQRQTQFPVLCIKADFRGTLPRYAL